MKSLYTTLLLLSFSTCMLAQTNTAVINANNIRTMMHSTGQLFWDFQDAQFLVPFTDPNSPAAIFAGGLWMGGLAPDGDIKIASTTYEARIESVYEPGLREAAADLNKVWKITKEDVLALIEDAADGSIDNPIPADILDWPGAGAEGVENIDAARLANFVDTDGDGLYNPQVGDYPAVIVNGVAVIPDEMLYTIFQPNDVNFVNVPSVDVHSSMYAFRGESDDALSNSLFLQQRIISREVEDLNTFRFSYFIDADLGCHTDDYVGCDIARNAMITYNADDTDGNNGGCAGAITTYDDPPMISLTLLNQPMTHFTYYNNAGINNPEPPTTDPQLPQEEYAIMGGIWRDGSQLTSGGNGYDPASMDFVRHAFPGNPNNANEWSMISENVPLNDPRTLTTHQIQTLRPGQILTFDAVINFVNCPGYLTDYDKVLDNIDELQQLYDDGFERITATKESSIQSEDVQLYPNPSTGKIYVKSQHQFESYSIKNLNGSVLLRGYEKALKEIDVPLGNGIYLIELNTEQGQQYFDKIIIQN